MSRFSFSDASLPGLRVITPFYAEDIRGSFMKSFERYAFQGAGVCVSPIETLYTRSARGTIRGLHFQRRHSQDKLVHVLHGAVFDVAVDLREGSPSFGRWEGFELSAENRRMLYIPKGFAHGFLALEEDTLFSYLCGDRYDPQTDGGVRWDDPDLRIRWPLEKVEQLIVSEKDKALPTLAEALRIHRPLFEESFL